MLVLARKVEESILIGDDIEIMVVRLEGKRVHLGITAPREVKIMRSELLEGESEPVAAER